MHDPSASAKFRQPLCEQCEAFRCLPRCDQRPSAIPQREAQIVRKTMLCNQSHHSSECPMAERVNQSNLS